MTKTDLPPSSIAAFTEALWGDSGSLDAWLEANDESEVAAHIEAYASTCVSSATAEKDAEIERLRKLCRDMLPVFIWSGCAAQPRRKGSDRRPRHQAGS